MAVPGRPILAAGVRSATIADLAATIRKLEESERAVPPHRFTTQRGSSYVLLPDGSTMRYKAARQEHPGEVGWMEKSDRTAFLTPESANALSVVQATGPRRMTLVQDTDTPRIAVAYQDELRPIRGTIVDSQPIPAAGMLPLEMRKGYTPHFGNVITDLDAEPNWADWLERAARGLPPPVFGGAR